MAISINSIYEIAILVIGFIAFAFLAWRNFERALYLVIIFLPLYILKVKLFIIPFNVLEILIWFLFAVWILRGAYRNIDLSKFKDFLWPVVLILGGVILGLFISDNFKISAGIFKGWFLTPLIFALILVGELKGDEKKKNIFWSFYISAVLVAIIALSYYIGGKVTFDGRLSAFFLSPNHLAMYLAPGFLAGLGLFGLTDSRKQRILLAAGLFICGLSIYFTFSYLAWISVLAAAAFWPIIKFKWLDKNDKKLLLIGCLLFVILLAGLFFSQFGSEKLDNLLHSDRSSWQSRLMIWRAAGEIIKDHPILGIGAGMFQGYYLKYQSRFSVPYLEWAVPQPHNLFLAFWLQAGLAGLVGLIWLLAVFFKKTFSLLKNKNQLALILIILMGYIILHGLLDTTYFKNDSAVIFWIIIALAI
ncbi:MAG: O-antigen ligase family protein [Candidatus Portnoybacteria bacterium]|nr:O-antigen ligase family protein [Candidatus Portnoybacteria bacterium]